MGVGANLTQGVEGQHRVSYDSTIFKEKEVH